MVELVHGGSSINETTPSSFIHILEISLAYIGPAPLLQETVPMPVALAEETRLQIIPDPNQALNSTVLPWIESVGCRFVT